MTACGSCSHGHAERAVHRHRCNSFIPDDPGADHRHFRDKFTGPGALYGIWRKGAAHLSAADLIHAGAEISGHLPAVPR